MSLADPIRHHPPVTTTDALKAAALVLILVDHIGHFFAPDWPMLRVIGRLGAPIFFFLIGFAKTRTVPYRWLVLGTVLTGVDYLWTGTLNETLLNILFNFALVRIAQPFVQQHALNDGWRIGALVAFCLAVAISTGSVIEYGSNGWLFALFGLLHRRVLDEGQNWASSREAVMLVALAAYLVMEIRDNAFDLLHAGLLSLGVGQLVLVLGRFRREDLARQPGARFAQGMRFCGRHSLEIYAAQIIGLAAIGGLWSTLDPDEGEDDV